jgi:hypothetical protein
MNPRGYETLFMHVKLLVWISKKQFDIDILKGFWRGLIGVLFHLRKVEQDAGMGR